MFAYLATTPRQHVFVRLAVAIVACALFLLVTPSSALARAGDLDTIFNGGSFTTTLSAGPDAWNGSATQPDGKVLTVGRIAAGPSAGAAIVMRFTRSGLPDTSFGGGDGQVTYGPLPGPTGIIAYDVAVLADNSILVAAENNGAGQYLVLKYDSAGVPVADFGAAGVATIIIPGAYPQGPRAMAIQSDGKIVLAGYHSVAGEDRGSVVRFTASGAVDLTFGGFNGIATYGFAGFNTRFADLSIAPDGKIVAVGTFSGNAGDAFIAQFTAAGVQQSNTVLPIAGTQAYGGLVLGADGAFYVAGWDNNPSPAKVTVTRYIPGLTIPTVDTSWATSGISKFAITSVSDIGHSIALQGDGRLVVVANVQQPISGNIALGVARLKEDGSLDSTFGTGGAAVQLIRGNGSFPPSVNVATDGGIVAAGTNLVAGSTLPYVQRLIGLESDVGVTVSNPAAVLPGASGSMTATVTNSGADTATGITLSDVGGAGVVSAMNPSQGACSGTTCVLGALSPGATASITITFSNSVAGTIARTFTVASTTYDSSVANNTGTGEMVVGRFTLRGSLAFATERFKALACGFTLRKACSVRRGTMVFVRARVARATGPAVARRIAVTAQRKVGRGWKTARTQYATTTVPGLARIRVPKSALKRGIYRFRVTTATTPTTAASTSSWRYLIVR